MVWDYKKIHSRVGWTASAFPIVICFSWLFDWRFEKNNIIWHKINYSCRDVKCLSVNRIDFNGVYTRIKWAASKLCENYWITVCKRYFFQLSISIKSNIIISIKLHLKCHLKERNRTHQSTDIPCDRILKNSDFINIWDEIVESKN